MTSLLIQSCPLCAVTVPLGWTLVIDQDTPLLNRLIIQGEVRFDPKAVAVNQTITVRWVMPHCKHGEPLRDLSIANHFSGCAALLLTTPCTGVWQLCGNMFVAISCVIAGRTTSSSCPRVHSGPDLLRTLTPTPSPSSWLAIAPPLTGR